jgi:hypothetical protein
MVQGIGRQPPKLAAEVRVLLGAPARSTKDVRLPPKQKGASSSLAGPTTSARAV